MARHRDIRNMDYTDDYDGYDDVYGHSLDDDYYISPSNRQFVYNRESSRDGRFEHEDDIQEVDEVDELSDIDKAKLQSCIDQVKETFETTTVSRNELINLILKYKFNVELVVNALLEDTKFENNTGLKEKDVTQFSSSTFPIAKKEANINDSTLNLKIINTPNIFSLKQSDSSPKNFNISNILGREMMTNSEPTCSSSKNFSISGTNIDSCNLGSKNSNITEQFNSKAKLSISSSKSFNIPNIFDSQNHSNAELSNSSPKNFNIPNIFNSKTDSNRELSNISPKPFNIPNIFNSKTDSNIELSNSSPNHFNIPNIFNSKIDSNTELSNSSPKNFNIPNISNSKTELISSSPKSFTIPKVFDSQAEQFMVSKEGNSKSGINAPRQLVSTESDKEYSSLSELVNSHLKNSLPADSLSQGSDMNEISTMSTKLSSVCLSEPKSFSTNDIRKNFNIDLTKAIKTVSSLPSFSKNKENMPEKFEIPFIDCDTVVKTDKTAFNSKKRLTCNLDIKNTLNWSDIYFKNPSKLGKVICRKYRNLKRKIILPERQIISSEIKIFLFNTISPDDFIGSHLKK